MAGKSLFTVTGDAKIIRAFKELGGKVTRQIVKPSVKKASEKFRNAIRPNVPVRTGALLKSAKVKTAKGPRAFSGRSVVAMAALIGQSKPSKSQAAKGTRIPFYAFMQEKGYHTGKRVRQGQKVMGYTPLKGHAAVKWNPGKHFTKKALTSVEGPAKQQMLAEIYQGIEQIAGKG